MKKIIIVLCIIMTGCTSLKKEKNTDIAENMQSVKVERPTPITLPKKPVNTTDKSQLIKVEEFIPASLTKSKNPVQAITNAHNEAKETPSDENFINAITEYVYQEGRVYQIYCAPGRVTDLIFNKGESFTIGDIAEGDSHDKRWLPPKLTVSGSGDNKRLHMGMRPVKPGLEKNMTISTNQQTYYLEFKSYKNTFQTAVRWTYPHLEYQKKIASINMRSEKESNEINNISIDNMNFDYEVVGQATWKPIRVFDDGKKTYIKFPKSVEQGELPPLFLVGRDNETQIVNCRYNANYYVLDRLFEVALLKIGKNKQDQVHIYNKTSNRYEKVKYSKRIVHSN